MKVSERQTTQPQAAAQHNAGADFSPELQAYIGQWKEKPGNIIMILHKVQEEKGYISPESAREIADLTDTPLAKVYGVMTFYHLFKMTPPGKNQITVCLGTACYLKGGQDILDEARKVAGLKEGQTVSDDRNFSVEAVRCLGCCGIGPVMTLNGKVYGKLTTDMVSGIMKKAVQ
jgi:NADH-quinone oxidoreductase subunit E